MQCGRYLDEHRSWEKHSFKNTAMAAKKVKEEIYWDKNDDKPETI